MKICPQCECRYPADVRFCPSDGTTLRMSDGGADLIGQVIADRYIVLEKLGEGGMGRVYLAEHVRMGRRSALKVMHPGMVHDADAIARFNREAANASRINHPNVAAIYDFGETSDGLIYLAMEYIDGEPLTALVERQGALQAPRAAAIAVQVAEALAAAHEMGIVHRDLKPDNVMIARGREGADIVKVVDFGIAKSTGGGAQRVTRTGFIVGTPEYMSPEQLAGDALDGRSDIYALGLVTFHLLTGALPFPSATVQESMIMRLTERPRTLAEVRGGIAWPAALQAVLDRALAREAQHRHADAREFARELRAAVEHMPETDAAAAGTLLMSASLPATRVAPAGEANAAATVLASAPSSDGVAARRQASAPGRRARTPLVAAAAVAIAVLGGLGAFALQGGFSGETRGTDDTSAANGAPAGANAPQQVADSGTTSPPTLALDPRAADGTSTRGEADPALYRAEDRGSDPSASLRIRDERSARGPETSGAARPDAGERPRAPAFDARAALDTLAMLLDPDSASAARGQQGLAEVDRLLPQLTNRADIAEALYRRAEAYAMLEDQSGACSTLADLRRRSDVDRSSAVWKSVSALHQMLGCTP